MTTDALGMLLGTLTIISTFALFITKEYMLGFPAVIFWGILGGFSYAESAATWDIHYFLFFASMGMAIFCSIAMYVLRTGKEEEAIGDELIDEGKDTTQYIDEGKGEETSRTRRGVRDRADKRRNEGIKRNRRW